MLRPIIIFFFAFGLLVSASAWSADDEQSLYLRPAKPQEIIGIWSILPLQTMYFRYRYVAITADGRIGWIGSNVERKAMDQSTVIEMIDNPDKFEIQTSGWKPCIIADSVVTVAAINGHAESYFGISVITDVRDSTTRKSWVRGVSGDLVMQQYYRLPADVSPTGLPPNIHALPPSHLRRITE